MRPSALKRLYLPTLISQGSDPKTWSLSPAPPSFFSFDTGSGQLTQKDGTAGTPTLMSKTTYTLQVVNANGLGTTTFTIEVVPDPA